MTARATGSRGRMSNLQTRILTGLLFGFPVLGLTWAGGRSFIVFSIIAGGAVFYEWNRLAASLQGLLTQICGWICYAVVGVALFCGFSAWVVFLILLAGVMILVLLAGRRAGWVAGGLVYSALLAITLGLLRGEESSGLSAVCFLYAVVWGTDTGAYFCGRAFGGPKLAPEISPGKTWSGAVGGVVAGVSVGVCVALLMMHVNPAGFSVPVLALLLSVISQVGDLGESWIKRHFRVKDSGTVLPGHGGVMDRVDGLVTVSVVLYIIGAAFAGPDVPAGLFHLL